MVELNHGKMWKLKVDELNFSAFPLVGQVEAILELCNLRAEWLLFSQKHAV